MNIPVQVISCTDTDGKITPMRFRFVNEQEELVTIENLTVCRRAENMSILSFVCETTMEGRKSEFTLVYRIRDHIWFLQI